MWRYVCTLPTKSVYILKQMEHVIRQNSQENFSIQEFYLLSGLMLSLENKEGFFPPTESAFNQVMKYDWMSLLFNIFLSRKNQQGQKYTGIPWSCDPIVTSKTGLWENLSMVAMFHTSLYTPFQNRIYSCLEVENNNLEMEQRRIKASHRQRIETRMNNGYSLALSWLMEE